MNRSVWLRKGVALTLPLAMVAGVVSVHAEVVDPEPNFSLRLATALRERTFMRAGVIAVDVKTSSGSAYDVTGPVVNRGDITAAAPVSGLPLTARNNMITAGNALDAAMDQLGISGLGTPEGVKARSDDSLTTAGLSVGYYLSDDFTWLVEAYVLAAPLKSKIYGDGVNATGNANGISGQHILNTKLLPPTVLFGRYWGDKKAKFRPYTGVMAMYAIFFDTEATQTLNSYVGGASPGDTSVSLKNAFGIGPAIGFKYQVNDDWHISMNVGSVKLKTQATLTTRNTTITNESAVLAEYGQPVLDAIEVARGFTSNYYTSRGGAVTVFMRGLSTARGLSNGELGTYVRKQDTSLTSTAFMFSVGRSF